MTVMMTSLMNFFCYTYIFQTILPYLLFYRIDMNSTIWVKKRLQHWSFPVNIAKFLRTTFLKESRWWLFLFYHQKKGVKHG